MPENHPAQARDRRDLLRMAGMTAASGVAALASRPVLAADQSQSTGPSHTAGQSVARGTQVGGLRRGMIGYMLPHEQFMLPDLVKIGALAAHAKFDLLANSDHFQPWQDNEAHSGSAWVTMAAMGERAAPAWMGTTVTCPTLRYNPAVV